MGLEVSRGGPAGARIQFLSIPASHTAGGEAHVLSANDAALLALPCIDPSLTRDRLVALLWPDASRQQGLVNLRQRRFRLKQLLGSSPLVGVDGDRLALCLPHDLATPEAHWHADASALPGELLGSLSYPESEALEHWVQHARERWRERRATALRAAAARCEDERQWDAALPYRQRLCDDDPLDEAAHADLMRLHYLRADEDAVHRVFDGLRFRLARELEQPPSAATMALFDRLTAAPAAHPATQVLLLRPPRQVGREGTRQTLRQAQARGATAVVQGEPGMGKTRLMQDHLRGQPGAVMVALRPVDATTPFGLLARLARAVADQAPAQALLDARAAPTRAQLAAIVPEWGVPETRPAGPALQHALGEWLRLAGIRVVAVDDLQLADPESLAVLTDWLHRAEGAEPPWWLLTVRRAEVPAAVQQWLNAADANALVRLDLPPLGLDDIADLLHLLALPGLDPATWAAPLLRHSGGNPLFLLETVRALNDAGSPGAPAAGPLPLPARVGELLQRRIAQLEGPAARLAAVAAVAGDDLDAELAAAVLDTHPLDLAPPWAELERAQVLHDRAFTHDLLRDAARQTLPAAVAAALHARMAEHLVARGERVAPERVARHWAAAGRFKKAGAAYVLAARRSRKLRRRDDEARWWQHAIDVLAPLGAGLPEHVDAQAERIESTLLTQGPEAALASADTLLPQAVTDAQRLLVQLGRLKAFMLAGQFAAADELAPEVAALAQREGHAHGAATAQIYWAQAQGQAGQTELALERLRACEPAVQTLADDELRYEHLMAQGYLLRLLGRHRDTLAAHDRALPIVERLSDPQELLTLLSNRALVHYDLGRSAASHADATRARALHARLGDVTSVAAAVCTTHVGAAAASLGRHTEALALYDAARATFVAAGGGDMWLRQVDLVHASLFVQLGQFARAGALLGGDWHGAAPQHQLRRHLLLARLARWQGQLAAPHVEAARQACAGVRPALRAAFAALVQVEASHAVPAPQACGELQAALDDVVLSEEAPAILLARSRLAECLIETDPAAALVQATQCWAESADCRVHDSMTSFWHACARVFRACGDAPRADAVVHAAAAWLRDVALPNTPEAYRPSFVARNPAVRALLAWARSTRSVTPK